MSSYLDKLSEQSKIVQSDLVDSLDLYLKDYKKSSNSMISKAQEKWDVMHIERTNMLWSKEEYLNTMQSYHTLQGQVESLKNAVYQN
jgi:hypothetical protein